MAFFDQIMRRHIQAMGKCRASLSAQGFGTANYECKAVAGRRLERNCIDCLWNWQNVHTNKGRVCYSNLSPYYHKKAPKKACRAFESKVPGAYEEDNNDEAKNAVEGA